MVKAAIVTLRMRASFRMPPARIIAPITQKIVTRLTLRNISNATHTRRLTPKSTVCRSVRLAMPMVARVALGMTMVTEQEHGGQHSEPGGMKVLRLYANASRFETTTMPMALKEFAPCGSSLC